jgi:hypothetical protein
MPPEESPADRRSNHELREVLNDLMEHVREISQKRGDMGTEEIDYAQQRLEWLADEAWRLAAEEQGEE